MNVSGASSAASLQDAYSSTFNGNQPTQRISRPLWRANTDSQQRRGEVGEPYQACRRRSGSNPTSIMLGICEANRKASPSVFPFVRDIERELQNLAWINPYDLYRAG